MSLTSLGIVVVLFSVTIAGLVYLADVNRYKGKIVDLLKKHTGRAFQIQDRIRLTFYPWAGLNLGKVRIGNAQGFEATDFADIRGVKVRIRVSSLFARRVVVDTIRVEGVDVNLTRNADGVTNWDDLLELAQQFIEPPAASEGEAEKPKKRFLRMPSMPTVQDLKNINIDQLPINPEDMKILGMEVNDMNLTFEDHVNQAVFKMAGLKMKTSAISLNEPIEVQVNTMASARNLKVMEGLAFDSEMEIETKVKMRIERSIPVESLKAE